MMGFALITLIAVVLHGGGNSTVARQRVDLIELNHSLDDSGRHAFDQLVFYEWSSGARAYRVIAWRMLKRQAQIPQRTWLPHGYRIVWQDDGLLREVWTPAFRETWSRVDPERENRRLFSEAHRPDLVVPRSAKSVKVRRY